MGRHGLTPDMPHFEITDNWESTKGGEEEMTRRNSLINLWTIGLLKGTTVRKRLGEGRNSEQAKAEGITDGTAPQAFATREQGGCNDFEGVKIGKRGEITRIFANNTTTKRNRRSYRFVIPKVLRGGMTAITTKKR